MIAYITEPLAGLASLLALFIWERVYDSKSNPAPSA